MGKGRGTQDSQGRGIVVLRILEYVALHRPEIVLLENVKGLLLRHQQTLSLIVSNLEASGYFVSWRLLDSCTHGAVPHRRPRVYILALRPSASWPLPFCTKAPDIGRNMLWPAAIPCPPLSSVMDPVCELPDYNRRKQPCGRNKTYRTNLAKAFELVRRRAQFEAKEPSEFCVVVDLAGSTVQMGWQTSPCLTKSHAGALAYWSIQHDRFLTTKELCRLQCVDIAKLNMTSTTDRQLGAMLGNGFTASMIARIVGRAIQAMEAGCNRGELAFTVINQNLGDGSIRGYDTLRGTLGADGTPLPPGHATGGPRAASILDATGRIRLARWSLARRAKHPTEKKKGLLMIKCRLTRSLINTTVRCRVPHQFHRTRLHAVVAANDWGVAFGGICIRERLLGCVFQGPCLRRPLYP